MSKWWNWILNLIILFQVKCYFSLLFLCTRDYNHSGGEISVSYHEYKVCKFIRREWRNGLKSTILMVPIKEVKTTKIWITFFLSIFFINPNQATGVVLMYHRASQRLLGEHTQGEIKLQNIYKAFFNKEFFFLLLLKVV